MTRRTRHRPAGAAGPIFLTVLTDEGLRGVDLFPLAIRREGARGKQQQDEEADEPAVGI
jgi:hypothetical protein